MQTSSRLSRGYIIALTATVLWSFTGILISYLSKTYSLPSLVLAFWRDLFVSFGMVVGLLDIQPRALSSCPHTLGIYGFIWLYACHLQFHVDIFGAI